MLYTNYRHRLLLHVFVCLGTMFCIIIIILCLTVCVCSCIHCTMHHAPRACGLLIFYCWLLFPCTHRAIVLVVDSFNFPQETRSVAELIFDLLSDKVTHKRKLAILVVCNKQDLALVSGQDYIKKRLEAEMYNITACVLI